MRTTLTHLASLAAIAALGTAASAGTQGMPLCLDSTPDIDTSPHDVGVITLSALGAPGQTCALIDFEGLGDNQLVGTIPGPIDVTFGPSWLSLIDADDGGNGNFANEPSESTVVYFLTSVDPIDFSQPVQFVQVSYVASAQSLPLSLTAWDGPGGTGNIVDVTQGNTLGTDFDGASCGGDPSGAFCLWDVLTLTAPTNSIRSITLSGAVADQFAFDDMTFCTTDPIERYCFGVGCPCGNDDPLAGCANSSGTGASLEATGSPSVVADDLVLTVSNTLPNQFGVVYFGGAQECTPFGDGLRAVAPGPPGQYVRFPVQQADALGDLIQGPGLISEMSMLMGNAVSAGDTWYFQGYYRDPAGPCSNSFNLSNGLGVTFSL